MSWAIGYDSNWKRDIGYGVPCVCDSPKCNESIDRGLAHVCGGEPYGGDLGCGLYFCEAHHRRGTNSNLCSRCEKGRKPYDPKPDTDEWIMWKLKDKSWAEWRRKNEWFVRKWSFKMNLSSQVFAFECGIAGRDFRTVVNARTRGKAKSQYWRNVIDAFQGLPYTKVTARKIGSPRTSEQFKLCAKNRGLPQLRCGDRVKLVSGETGVVVGHNPAANFNVLFDDDSKKYSGMELSVHPSELEVLK